MINRTILIRLSLLLIIFLASILWLMFLVQIAPETSNYKQDDDSKNNISNQDHQQEEILDKNNQEYIDNNNSIKFPSNLKQLKQLAKILIIYSKTNPGYVLLLFCSAYLFKQTFAIPGSVFMNLLGGAIYGTWYGFPLCCLLTAIGASCCYLLSVISGLRSLLYYYYPDKLEFFHKKIYENNNNNNVDDDEPNNNNNLLWILISLRLFPMTPNWFLNIASPVVGIPIQKFFLSVFLGLMPYNFICVQTGSILSQIQSMDDIFTIRTFFSLFLIALVFMVPILVKQVWTTKLSSTTSTSSSLPRSSSANKKTK